MENNNDIDTYTYNKSFYILVYIIPIIIFHLHYQEINLHLWNRVYNLSYLQQILNLLHTP